VSKRDRWQLDKAKRRDNSASPTHDQVIVWTA
jgi:hypothetical protein